MKPLLEVLTEARALLADPKAWTQGQFARGRWGGGVDVLAPGAQCFCAVGATMRVDARRSYRSDVSEALEAVTPPGFGDMARYNDDPITTHADILAIFDRAIAKAEGGGR